MALSTATNGTPVLARAPAATRQMVEPPRLAEFLANTSIKWSWACRSLAPHAAYRVVADRLTPPRPGDVALVQVESLGYHDRIMTAEHDRLRMYPGDVVAVVFGHRYATDAYEAEVSNVEKIHLLTGAGMAGSVISRRHGMKAPSQMTFLGYLSFQSGERINLKALHRPYAAVDRRCDNVVLMLGTGMNSGKTTTAATLTRALLRAGLRVAACKSTGSVSHRDLNELRSTGAHDVRDFSDYGFPSTYLCDEGELVDLYDAILTDAARVNPDVVVMEMADGVLQRETRMLMANAAVRSRVRGVVLSGGCAPSALFGLEQVRSHGLSVAAVSGRITSSPLFMREFIELSNVPMASSVDDGDALARLVIKHCRLTA